MTPSEATRGFSRRALLKGGLASLALVAISGAALALQRSKLRAVPAAGLRVLTATEYSILAAISERMVPAASTAGGAAVPGHQGIDVALAADRVLERADADAVQGVKLALALFESGLTGALFLERTQPFTQLAPEAQNRVLLAFRESSVPLRRTLYRSFAGLTGSLYYGDPLTWPSLGYPGPPDAHALRSTYAAQLVDYDALRPKSG